MSITERSVKDAITEALNKRFTDEFHLLAERSDGVILFTIDRKQFAITVATADLYPDKPAKGAN